MTSQAARIVAANKRPPVSTTVKVISFLAFVYATLGYLNQTYFHWVDTFWLSGYSDKVAIVAFGIWRVSKENNPYTRQRVAILTFLVAVLWMAIPFLTGSNFFNHHLNGSIWFFAYLIIVFAFGRRADCSWNCPCVGLRDTAGDAFREQTPKGGWLWTLRHLKWVYLGSLVVYLALSIAFADSPATRQYIFWWWTITNALYFASFLIIPWTGNRNFCRFLCPWGALYGTINKLGFYKIVADKNKCVPCRICESACDMGVPIKSLIEKYGEFNVADCVGCGRCVTQCPRGALRIVDIRDYVRAGIAAVNREAYNHLERGERWGRQRQS